MFSLTLVCLFVSRISHKKTSLPILGDLVESGTWATEDCTLDFDENKLL